ncbi:MAG: hypothetical protein AAFO69_01820, partial [Bacteroidota bacterium]
EEAGKRFSFIIEKTGSKENGDDGGTIVPLQYVRMVRQNWQNCEEMRLADTFHQNFSDMSGGITRLTHYPFSKDNNQLMFKLLTENKFKEKIQKVELILGVDYNKQQLPNNYPFALCIRAYSNDLQSVSEGLWQEYTKLEIAGKYHNSYAVCHEAKIQKGKLTTESNSGSVYFQYLQPSPPH